MKFTLKIIFGVLILSILIGCNDSNESNYPLNVDMTSDACGDSGLALGNDRFSIHSYMALSCKNSSDLNGVWLAISKWEQSLYDNWYVEEKKGTTRKILYIKELPENEIYIDSCGGYDPIFSSNDDQGVWTRDMDKWYRKDIDSFHVADIYTVYINSNDHLSLIRREVFGFGGGYYRTYDAEVELIKISALDFDREIGQYYANLESREELFALENKSSVHCFKESEGEIRSTKNTSGSINDVEFMPYYEFYARGNSDNGNNSLDIEFIEGQEAQVTFDDGSPFEGVYSFSTSVDSISSNFVDTTGELELDAYINLSVQ